MLCQVNSGYTKLHHVSSDEVILYQARSGCMRFVLVSSGYFRLDQVTSDRSGLDMIVQVRSR
jgi:hypothetical protein